MLLKGKTGLLTNNKSTETPINTLFLEALQQGIEQQRASKRLPSNAYTPSGMNCIRQMFYKRSKYVPDPPTSTYSDIGMAQTGTDRHEDIQNALLYMTSHGSRFLYVDVETYVRKRQEQGKCLQLEVRGKDGAETALYDKDRNVSFRCDGIIYDKVTKEFYLFEFKNQISSTAAGKVCVDAKHYCQVNCYCAELCLSKALVTYENRDTCQLYVPEIFEVTDYDKASIMSKIDECENFVIHSNVPPRPDNLTSSECRWCNYRSYCKLHGAEGGIQNGSSNA